MLCKQCGSLILAIAIISILPGSLAFADETLFVLTSEQWNVPRNETTILQMPALQALMKAYQATPTAGIRIKYPGGDEGTLWASELRAWLISLGVASTQLELVPGSRDVNTLELHLIENMQKH